GGTPDSKNEDYWNGDIYWATLVDLPANDHISIITDTQRKITQQGLKNSSAKIVPPDSVIVSSRATIGRVGINKVPLATNQGFKNIVIKDRNSADTMFVALMAKRLAPEMETLASGGTFKEITKTNFSTLQIPLPPLETQRQVVDEIAAYQHIIAGARQVVKGWKPNLELELAESLPEGVDEWETVKLGDVCTFEYGKSLKADNRIEGEFPVYGSNGVVGYHNEYSVEAPFLVVGRKGSAGEVHYSDKNGFPIDTTFYIKLENEDKVTLKFLFHTLANLDLQSVNTQAGVPGLNRNDAYRINILLPPLEIQREIVARIERERAIVEGNRELIRLYEEKVKKVIERVWES
ncbi:MAG: restriction endonuclease subunit S, partial [Anaerolineales bacterium]|nr:restriction endonuclease subunit S [Anaerolineales bacterium]